MLRAVCSTPLSSSLLGPPGTSALPRLSRSPFTSTLPSSSASISTTQVRPYSWAPPSLDMWGTGCLGPQVSMGEIENVFLSLALSPPQYTYLIPSSPDTVVP